MANTSGLRYVIVTAAALVGLLSAQGNNVIQSSSTDVIQVGSASSPSVALKSSGGTTVDVALSVGSSVASAGTVRLPSAGSVKTNNNAGNGDITEVATDSSDNLNVGNGAGTTLLNSTAVQLNTGSPVLKLGATVASTGDLRGQDTFACLARNHANSGDVSVINKDASDNINIGSGAGSTLINSGAMQLVSGTPTFKMGSSNVTTAGTGIQGAKNLSWYNRNNGNTGNIELVGTDSSDNETIGAGASTILMSSTQVQVTASPATMILGSSNTAGSGNVRGPNGLTIKARNNANSADTVLVGNDTNDSVNIGDNAATVLLNATAVQLNQGTPTLKFGGSGVPSTGNIRFIKQPTVVARNNANSADLTIFSTDTSDRTLVGDTGQGLMCRGTAIGFFNSTGTSQGTVTGSRASGAALTSLLTVLAGYGLIVDGSSL